MPVNSGNKIKDSIAIYTDGSCHTQLKSGGWAAILFVEQQKIVLDGKDENTTHHRMELTAVIRSLEYLKTNNLLQDPIDIYSDSQYVVDLVKRKDRLAAQSFLTKKLNPVRNVELVKELISYMEKPNIKFIKIKAHQKPSNIEGILNREVDFLSRKKMRS
jgi:ribonuclease HI